MEPYFDSKSSPTIKESLRALAVHLALDHAREAHAEAERCWELYDAAFQAARLAEDAAFAANAAYEKLAREVQSGRR